MLEAVRNGIHLQEGESFPCLCLVMSKWAYLDSQVVDRVLRHFGVVFVGGMLVHEVSDPVSQRPDLARRTFLQFIEYLNWSNGFNFDELEEEPGMLAILRRSQWNGSILNWKIKTYRDEIEILRDAAASIDVHVCTVEVLANEWNEAGESGFRAWN